MKTSEHHRQHGEHAGEVRQQLGGDRGPENQRTAGGEEEDGQTALQHAATVSSSGISTTTI